MDTQITHTLGQYELYEVLGAGAMGTVYRAYQPGLRREVAVKTLPPLLGTEPGYMERFIREAETAARLEHPHIVPVYDYGTENGTSYVVMRLLTGGSLEKRLEQRVRERKLPTPVEVGQMLRQVAAALDYAHSEGVIHRDIKPSNIVFDRHGNAYVVDFGIARLLQEGGTRLTASHQMIGTPAYMSPEQCAGVEVVPASDQYSLAVMAYVTMTGRLPFNADSALVLINKHLQEPPTPLLEARADLPVALQDVLAQALDKNPDARYPNVSDFAGEFEAAGAEYSGRSTGFFSFSLPAPTVPAPTMPGPAVARTPHFSAAGSLTAPMMAPPPRRRRNPLLLLFSVLVLLGAGMFALAIGGGSPTSASVPGPAAESTEEATAAASATATPTLTATATATEAATYTPQPTATPGPPMASALVGLNVRSGPSTQHLVIGSLAEGQEVEVLAVSPDGQWYKIVYYNSTGWVFGQLVEVSGDTSGLPVESGPPPPPSSSGSQSGSGQNNSGQSSGSGSGSGGSGSQPPTEHPTERPTDRPTDPPPPTATQGSGGLLDPLRTLLP